MSASSNPLGTADEELARLTFQHEVWGGVTRAFLDRLKLERGARVVDLGSGPGLVTAELAARVGRSGAVLAVDESARSIFRAAGLETVALAPHVLCGAPGSPAFRWAGRFFPHFSQKMQDEGLLAPEERALFLAEWRAREADPDALFFSPIVVDALARKPG